MLDSPRTAAIRTARTWTACCCVSSTVLRSATAYETFIEEVDRVLISISQALHSRERLADVGAMSRQRGGILQSLAYVFAFKLGVLADDVVRGHSVRHQIDDKRDSNSHPADTGASSHDGSVERNPVENMASLSVEDVVQRP